MFPLASGAKPEPSGSGGAGDGLGGVPDAIIGAVNGGLVRSGGGGRPASLSRRSGGGIEGGGVLLPSPAAAGEGLRVGARKQMTMVRPNQRGAS